MLNEKLQECFDLLDQIQRTYRNYNEEYVKILHAYPGLMDNTFEGFEQNCFAVFKMFPESQRQRVQELFEKETAEAQAKLEAAAMKEWEEKKKVDETAVTSEAAAKKAPEPKGKKPAPPPKKGKEPEKPVFDVPKIEVPKIKDFKSVMDQKYVIERSMEEIAEKLLKPAPTEEELALETPPKPAPESQRPTSGDKTAKTPAQDQQKQVLTPK